MDVCAARFHFEAESYGLVHFTSQLDIFTYKVSSWYLL